MFSKACEYGIRACLFIAKSSLNNERVALATIAEAINSPEAFTAKILQKLVRNNIIHSIKGPGGGFEISKEKMEQTPLKDVVVAIDGNELFVGCAMGLKSCDAKQPCPLHEEFSSIRKSLNNLLDYSSILSLALTLENGETFLKRLNETTN